MTAFTAASLHQSGQNELVNYLGFYPIPHGNGSANLQNLSNTDTPMNNYLKDQMSLNASLVKDENQTLTNSSGNAANVLRMSFNNSK